MQKLSKGFLPTSFNGTYVDKEFRENQSCRKRRTKNLPDAQFEDFYIPFSRLTSFDKMLLISFTKLWNSFDNHEIKLERNKLKFNSKLKSKAEFANTSLNSPKTGKLF